MAAQDTVRHGHRLLNLREPACVVGEWHRRDIRRRGHRVRPRVRIISLGRAVVRRLPSPEPLSRKRTGDGLRQVESGGWRVVGGGCEGWWVVGGGWWAVGGEGGVGVVL